MLERDWEIRAKERRLENKAIKKRVKEITISRDEWKSKYMKQKIVLEEMRKKVDIVKKNIQKIVKI